MFSSTRSQPQDSALARVSRTTILMQLGWIAAALCGSSVAVALPPCNEDQLTVAENYCEDTFGYAVLACGVAESGNLAVECCPYGHCDKDPVGPHYLDMDEEWTEDDEREEFDDTTSESEDADPLSDRDAELSDEGDDPIVPDDEDAEFEGDGTGGESDEEGAGDTGLYEDPFDHGSDDSTGRESTLVVEDGRLEDDVAIAKRAMDAERRANLDADSPEAESSAGCSAIGQVSAGWGAWSFLVLLGMTRRRVRAD